MRRAPAACGEHAKAEERRDAETGPAEPDARPQPVRGPARRRHRLVPLFVGRKAHEGTVPKPILQHRNAVMVLQHPIGLGVIEQLNAGAASPALAGEREPVLMLALMGDD